jgi:putative hemolysin
LQEIPIMATPCEALSFPQADAAPRAPSLSVTLAGNEDEIRQCQRLRYQIFAGEMGARIQTEVPEHDIDEFDAYCKHLLVRNTNTGEVVGTTRLLTDLDRTRNESFYSQTEFDLRNILRLSGRIMEVGRTCIHPYYRTGSTIAVLWQGLARMMVMHDVDYLVGCASISLDDGGANAAAIMARLRERHWAPVNLRVTPKIPLPPAVTESLGKPLMPSLLKAYLRIGAQICGEAYWDDKFNVADVFILVNRDQLDGRYARHFLQNS